MTHLAVSETHTGTTANHILEFLKVTGNSHTARELGHVLGLTTGTVRRRLTDLRKGNAVTVRASVRGPVRKEIVYKAA